MLQVEWGKIENEYIATKITYKDLAKKHGVSINTLKKRAQRGKWGQKRKDYRNSITTGVLKKVADKRVQQQADKLMSVQASVDEIGSVIAGVLGDARQFNRYIVQDYIGDIGETTEKEFEKVDTRAIKNLTSALKDLSYVIRNVYNLPTMQEHHAMQLAAERLQLDKQRADRELQQEDAAETGIVMLPAILPSDTDSEASDE